MCGWGWGVLVDAMCCRCRLHFSDTTATQLVCKMSICNKWVFKMFRLLTIFSHFLTHLRTIGVCELEFSKNKKTPYKTHNLSPTEREVVARVLQFSWSNKESKRKNKNNNNKVMHWIFQSLCHTKVRNSELKSNNGFSQNTLCSSSKCVQFKISLVQYFIAKICLHTNLYQG